MKKGLKTLWGLLEVAKEFVIKVISKLLKVVKDGGFFSVLTGTFEDDNMWIIDSGSSRHMTKECGQLQIISKETTSHSVELGDKKSYLVKGIGSTSLELEGGGNVHLNNILFILGLKKNLLSISCLEEKGDITSFINGKVLVWGKDSSIDKAKVIGIREGRLYRLLTPLSHALVHLDISSSELWHRRYGHLHYKILPSLSQMVKGIPNLKEDLEGVCKGCGLGKNVNKPFTSIDTRSKEILDLIHSNVCGPMAKNSLGGLQYYVTFIDHHSRNTWIYLVKYKDEVFEKFQEFKAKVDILIERKIKTLRSDNGGEYTSKELMAFCKEVGIKREVIVPYNPQQNGVVERKNGTLEECVRAMIHDQYLSKFLLGGATVTTLYIQNRRPHRILENDSGRSIFKKEA